MSTVPNTGLSVTSLTVQFANGAALFTAVDDVSFSVSRGESLAIVGQSGSGKSVTAHAIMGLLSSNHCRQSGTIELDGIVLDATRPDQLRHIRGKSIGMVFQEPMTALNPLHSVETQIRECLLIHQAGNIDQHTSRIQELLAQVELPADNGFLRKYPHELSGGQRQRVMIAMAIANNPSVLIADEPTTALDVTVQKQILDLIKALQKRLGMALLLITHDLGVVRRYSERIVVMKEGSIVETGVTRDVFDHPEHPYVRALLGTEPKQNMNIVRTEAPAILRVENLCVRFIKKQGFLRFSKSYVNVVDNVNLSIRRGETVGIVGESGSGKTTIAQAIARLIPSTGLIQLAAEDINTLSRKQLIPHRKKLQIVFQDPFASLSPRMTVGQIVSEGLCLHNKISPFELNAAIANAFKAVGLEEDAIDRYPHEFSGGQRQRIAIARTLVLEPELIILDEPTSALDKHIQAQIIDLLLDIQRARQISYLFISHDLKLVRAISHRIAVMRGGKIVETGPSTEIFENPGHDYTRQLLSAILH